MFSFLVILGTTCGCNWSVRAYGHFEVGRLLSPLALSPVVTAGLLSHSASSCLYIKHLLDTRPCTGPRGHQDESTDSLDHMNSDLKGKFWKEGESSFQEAGEDSR